MKYPQDKEALADPVVRELAEESANLVFARAYLSRPAKKIGNVPDVHRGVRAIST